MQPIRSSRACFLGLIGWYHLELPEQVITMEPCSRNNLHLQFCGRSNFALWGGVAEPRRTRQKRRESAFPPYIRLHGPGKGRYREATRA
jgi:hypothetical protein